MMLNLLYDTSSQPMAVGDILSYQMMGAVLCKENGYEGINFIFTFDPERPVTNVAAFRHITPANFHGYLEKHIPVGYAHALVKSVEVISHRKLSLRGDTWPAKIGGEYRFYEIMEKLLEHWEKFKTIPKFTCCRPNIDHRKCISVQLRKNRTNPARNLNYSAWVEFLKSRKEQFIIICDDDEIDDRMRLQNVTFSKDLSYGVLEDLAVVESTVAHMGATSGPCVVAMFNDHPYRLFNSQHGQDRAAGWTIHNSRGRFVYSTKNQWVLTDRETPELLTQELEDMLCYH